MSTLHYNTPIPRSSAWLERLILALGLCLPVPLLAVTGLSLPVPAAVERLAATLVPWAEDASTAQSTAGSAKGAIVLAPGEPAVETAAVAGVRRTLLAPSATSPTSAPARARTIVTSTPTRGLPRNAAPSRVPARGASAAPPSPAAAATTATPSIEPVPSAEPAPTPPRAVTTSPPLEPSPTPVRAPAPTPVKPEDPIVTAVEPVVRAVEPVVEEAVTTVTTAVEPVTQVVEPVTKTVDTVTGALPRPVGGLLPRLGG